MREWNTKENFEFLDPCNQQFLALRKDKVGNLFVELPASQRLTNPESTICIAINDIASTQDDLGLYELKNGTSTRFASDHFVGLFKQELYCLTEHKS